MTGDQQLPRSFSVAEVCEALGQTPRSIGQLVAARKVGCIRAGRSHRFLPEHVRQIIAAIEVKPQQTSADLLDRIGVTANGVARRRRG